MWLRGGGSVAVLVVVMRSGPAGWLRENERESSEMGVWLTCSTVTFTGFHQFLHRLEARVQDSSVTHQCFPNFRTSLKRKPRRPKKRKKSSPYSKWLSNSKLTLVMRRIAEGRKRESKQFGERRESRSPRRGHSKV